MKEAGDIAAVSVPFTAGIAAGTLAASHMSGSMVWTTASVVIIICGMLMFVQLYGRSGYGTVVLLFLAAGLSCSLTHGMCVNDSVRPGWLSSILRTCSESFHREIELVRFPHDTTNQLISAFLTGDRGGLTEKQTEAFRTSGASHILALSGLHLGVIYMIVCRLSSVAGNSRPARIIRASTVILLSGFYAMMTGAGPSIARALLFIIINEIGKLQPERKRSTVRTLLAALTLQLSFNPAVITSLGFQLSYLAMAGIAVIFPEMSSWYPRGRHVDPLARIWDSFSMAVSCQILTAPVVWMRFRTFPRYFIITNLFALPLTSAIMTLSVATLVMQSMGICPEILLKACDSAVQALYFILENISGMQTAG